MASVCKSGKIHYVGKESDDESQSGEEEISDDYKQIYAIASKSKTNLKVNITIFGKDISFKIDSGADVSAIPLRVYERHFGYAYLDRYDKVVKGYGGEVLDVKGVMKCVIEFNGKSSGFGFLVINKGESPVIGRDFFKAFNIQEIFLNTITGSNCKLVNLNCSNIVKEYSDLFKKEFGKLKDVKIKLELNDKCKEPIFIKARSVPFAFETDIQNQLKSLEKDESGKYAISTGFERKR